MRLLAVLALVAVTSARPDVGERYKYYAPPNPAPVLTLQSPPVPYLSSQSQQFANSQYSSPLPVQVPTAQDTYSSLDRGTLEVVPLNLAHVSTTVHRAGDVGVGLGPSYSGANLGYTAYSGANSQPDYSGYSSGAGLGYTSGASGLAVSSGSTGYVNDVSSGSGASADFQNLINSVLSGRYTVGSYSPNTYAATAPQRQKVNINVQPNQAPITFRHVYFAEAPPEAPVRPRVQVNGAIQNRKHVKVVFIKTPDQGGVIDQEISLPQLEEEKTQIYVLSKEHNHQPQIRIKAPGPSTASRPEIFFLKYRTEQDALRAQQVLKSNAGQDSFTTGAVLSDTGLNSGLSSSSSGLNAGAPNAFSSSSASGLSSNSYASGASAGFVSENSASLSSGSGNQYASDNYNSAASSGYQSTGLSSESSAPINDGASLASSVASLPLGNSGLQGPTGISTLYGAPVDGDVNSSGSASHLSLKYAQPSRKQ